MNMEELHMAAAAYYNNSASHLKQLAANFFYSMDTNGDGLVSFDEFYNFFRQSGYNWIDPNFFRSLDRNRDGSLDFYEVLTLYYVMKTRGVWCQNCKACLMELYFTCVQCFDTAPTTYDLCASCYYKREFCHYHATTDPSFLDNYVLLRSKRGLPPGEANLNLALVPQPYAANAPERSSWWTAFQALDMVLSVGNILASCSIM
ncbi:uncharacterized protein LOC133862394 [Alnus glutinosa]|uniref:uncharacterized protein LOC133862394 n=1 Tax=Alnus glutinosa TaxID=3517 RepID=UPI002D7774B5|nr:uncharacterized protein LOC133862394 [Alnus glutinosa]